MERLAISIILALLFGTFANAAPDVVVVVSTDSAMTSLSRTLLADIYLGRTHNMPDGTPIVPLDQSEASTLHGEFYEEFLDKSPAQIKAHWSKLIFTGRGRPPRSVANSEQMAAVVAENPGAIGYVDAGQIDSRLRVVPIE